MQESHIIGIGSTRPASLECQVRCFIQNASRFNRLDAAKFHFVIVDDTLDMEAMFQDQIETIQQYITENDLARSVSIEYWSYKNQSCLFDKILRGDCLLPEARETMQFMLSDIGLSHKHGGMRGVQNKLDLLCRIAAHDDSTYIHKIDDDIYPLTLDLVGDRLELTHKNDFFGTRYRTVTSRPRMFVGSHCSGDGMSYLRDLNNGVTTLHRFVELAAGVKCDEDDWSHIARSVFDSCAARLDDEYGLFKKPFVPISAPYHKVLSLLADATESMLAGTGGINYTTVTALDSSQWDGPRDFVPGCAVCYSAGTELPPTIPFGHQDIITSYYYASVGIQVIGELDVYHHKSMDARKPILDELGSSLKHDYVASLRMYQNILATTAYESPFSKRRSVLSNFFGRADKSIDRTLAPLGPLLSLIQDRSRWWWSSRNADATKKILASLEAIESRKEQLVACKTFGTPLDEADIGVLTAYNALSRHWPDFIRAAKRDTIHLVD